MYPGQNLAYIAKGSNIVPDCQHAKILAMKEGIPSREPIPSEIEVRRDALLLRIIELREAVTRTSLDQELVSKELSALDRNVQQVEGLLDMKIFEDVFDTLESIVDSKKVNK